MRSNRCSVIPERWWAVALVLLAIRPAQIHSQELAIHDGDHVVFYGDSITAQRLYTRFVEDFFLTHCPQMHVESWNAGIPGDTVYGGYTGDMPSRLKRDVIPHHPTVITAMLGMNDGYYMPFNPKYLEIYKDGFRKLLEGLQSAAPAARITLISPTPYDEVTHGTEFATYNEVVSHHAAFVKDLASTSHLGFSDFNQVETDLLRAGTQKDPSLAALLVTDRIHPAEASHWVMAATLARSWGLSPIVSRVRLDATTGTTVSAENTAVSHLTFSDGKLRWTQVDKSLPLPLPLDDEMIKFVLSISDLAAMDRQLLVVHGLPAIRYSLGIDGHPIASFTPEQLSSGVNLALYATPMQDQAMGVDGIELKRTRLDEARFLLAIEDPKASNSADAITALEAKETMLEVEQCKAAQPKPHEFELSPE